MSDFLPVPSEQEWTESDRQWFELVRSLRSQVAQLQTTISQLREKLKDVLDWVKVSVYDGDHLPPAGGVYCRGRAALAQKPEEEAKP